MTRNLTCSCGKELRVQESSEKKWVRCPECGNNLEVVAKPAKAPREEEGDDASRARRKKRPPAAPSRRGMWIGIGAGGFTCKEHINRRRGDCTELHGHAFPHHGSELAAEAASTGVP